MIDDLAACLELFYAIASVSNSSIIVADAALPDCPIVYVNPSFERMTGYAGAEVTGRNCRLLQGEDRDQPDRALIQAAIRDGSACEALLRNYRKNGEMFWNKLYMFPVQILPGKASYFIGVQHDVTREKRLVAELQETAAERARLIEELDQKRRHLTDLSLDLIKTQEMERRALALELHDELGQRLTALNLLLHRALPLFETGQAQLLWKQADVELGSLIGLVRNMAVSLRPPGLDYVGLEPSIRDLLSRQFACGPSWVFEYAGLPRRLPPVIEISVFRIVQESVTNVVRHARASRVVVEINGGADGRELELIVRDDGIGFDGARWRDSATRGQRAGLAGINERVRLLGGSFEVDSAPGRGTRITATIALPQPESAGDGSPANLPKTR